MLRDWIRRKQTLIAARDDARSWSAKLTAELEHLSNENAGLKLSLATNRVEINNLKDVNDKLAVRLAEALHDRDQARHELAELRELAALDEPPAEEADESTSEPQDVSALKAQLRGETARANALARSLDDLTQKSLMVDRVP
ncbi:hypothetical protein [Nonomuraea sp. NPDC049709]|uniref:hypothetical protein n=1 Tax=Nonomuraea sp. NPDC049709 TaxID=3154736 RepID=UPI0034322A37